LNRPEDEMDPQFVDQVEAVLAVNCWVAFSFTLADVGETVTEKAGRLIHATTKITKIRTGKNDIGISRQNGDPD